MNDEAIARWRLRNQALVGSAHADAAAVVGSLLAVQAENPDQSAWAVATRTRRPRRADIAHALDSGAIVRLHVLRPTWHYVLGEDARWLVELTGPRIRPVVTKQLHEYDGLSASQTGALEELIQRCVSGRSLTRPQLGEALAESGSPVSSRALMFLLADLELQALVCSGPVGDGVHRYALMADRIGAQRRRDRDEALAEVARRYFTGHGPATERDLAYWATLTLADVRRAIHAAGAALRSFEHDGRTFWHAADDDPPARKPRARAHLLQVLDEMYRGYQDSRWVLDAAGVVPRARESAIGMALYDGQLVASMKRTIGRQVIFDLAPYATWSDDAAAATERAAATYGAFLGLPAEVRLPARP